MRYRMTLLLLPLLLLSGCALAAQTDPSTDFSTQEGAAIMHVTGKIVFIPLEGGFYGIIADDGRQFDPLGLPEEFRKDSLPIRAVLKEVEGAVSFRMWGTIVEIVKIEKKLNTPR